MVLKNGDEQAMRWRRVATIILTLAITAPIPGFAETAMSPSESVWSVSPGLSNEKESLNISGIACFRSEGTIRSCLMVSDEKRYARMFRIEDHTIKMGDKVVLLPDEREPGVEFDETDAEGVDTEGSFYYSIGSHGLNRTGKFQESRFFVFRTPIEPSTGIPAGEVQRSQKLRHMLRDEPLIGKHAEMALGTENEKNHGVNIEGLAVQDGSLYVGFRGPVLDGTAYVLRVAIDAVFGDEPPDSQIFPIRLGEGVGIRDLAKVQGGFLVLTGPESNAGASPKIFFWEGKTSQCAASLGTLPQDAETKPEALLVLAEDATGYRVLILRDGAREGGPTEYVLPKTEARC